MSRLAATNNVTDLFLEIDQQRRALDPNGLRYLITMRNFYILNRRASEPSTPMSMANGTSAVASGLGLERRERLRYRDMIWAFHSESQELLLSASVAACSNGKMSWADARALGVFIWMQSREAMVNTLVWTLIALPQLMTLFCIASTLGGDSTQRVHGGRQPRPHRV